jgi:hypothetical protein
MSERLIKGSASDLKQFIDALSAETGVSAPDAERLLVKILAPQLRALYEAEVEAAAHAAALEEKRASKLRGDRARAHLRRLAWTTR